MNPFIYLTAIAIVGAICFFVWRAGIDPKSYYGPTEPTESDTTPTTDQETT